MAERSAASPPTRPRPLPLSALASGHAPGSGRQRRVLFSESFDPVPPPPPAAPEPEIIAPSFTLEDLQLARADAFEEGRKAGAAEAHASVSARHAAALETLAATLSQSVGEARAAAEATVAALGRALIDTLAGLLPRHATVLLSDRVERLLAELRTSLGGEVSLVASAAPESADALAAALARSKQGLAFPIPARIEHDPTLPPTAVRIAWSSAEAVIDLTAVAEALRQTLADVLSPAAIEANQRGVQT